MMCVAVVTQETLSYTCVNDNGGGSIVWTSSVWTGGISVVAGGVPVGQFPLTLTVSGVTSNSEMTMTLDVACINSTLTFNGTVSDLEQLNGVVLTCDDGAGLTDNVTIVTPAVEHHTVTNYSLCDILQ